MLDAREVSWPVAIARIVLSLVVIVAAVVALDVVIYLQATSSTYSERIAAAFQDAYDYGYSQTFEIGYREAREEAFDRGYSKGYEISLLSEIEAPASRLVETHNPTYAEMIAFLAADETDSMPFISGEYVCFDYSADLNNNADKAGLRAAYVRIRSGDWGHALVAFDTVDRGLVFIEPQSDVEVDLTLGKPYPWMQVGATSPLGYSDAIEQIQLIW